MISISLYRRRKKRRKKKKDTTLHNLLFLPTAASKIAFSRRETEMRVQIEQSRKTVVFCTVQITSARKRYNCILNLFTSVLGNGEIKIMMKPFIRAITRILLRKISQKVQKSSARDRSKMSWVYGFLAWRYNTILIYAENTFRLENMKTSIDYFNIEYYIRHVCVFKNDTILQYAHQCTHVYRPVVQYQPQQ